MLCPDFGVRLAAVIALMGLCACSPTLDWREVRPEDSGVVALFPCKPATDARMVTLAGARVRMLLTACRAGDLTWAVASANAEQPSQVGPALEALRAAAVANLDAPAQSLGQMQVSGMTPNAQADRVRIKGKLPDGSAVTLEAGYFAKGTWVFQATVMGAAPGSEAVATFFDNLKLLS